MTPLHHACRNGHINVVRILVQRGANYQKLTYLGASSMTLAAAGGHIELVKLLLDLRVSVNPSHTALREVTLEEEYFRDNRKEVITNSIQAGIYIKRFQ
uniref:ANK_REP_REGION domain-containing protein n=1 Tax=Parascaris equorum TaxID=6256 RepID=A0A914RT99_PAREQ